MNRELYIELRNKNIVDIELAYEFYVNRCTENCIQYAEFQGVFPAFLRYAFMEHLAIMGEFFEEYDTQFEVVKLTHNDGNISFI